MRRAIRAIHVDRGFFDVPFRALEELVELLIADLSDHPSWAAENQRSRWNDFAFRDQRVGANNAAPSNPATGEEDSIHPNQDLPLDGAAVDRDPVTNGHVLGNDRRVG